MVVQLTQLHGAVQIELVRFCCEAKHVEAVANGGTFSIAARLSLTRVNKGNRLVVHTPGCRDANEKSPVHSQQDKTEMNCLYRELF